MDPKEAKIVLDGQAYTIRRLTVGQLAKILPGMDDLNKARMQPGGSVVSTTMTVGTLLLHEALQKYHPSVKIGELEATLDEMKIAIGVAMELCGFQRPGELKAEIPKE